MMIKQFLYRWVDRNVGHTQDHSDEEGPTKKERDRAQWFAFVVLLLSSTISSLVITKPMFFLFVWLNVRFLYLMFFGSLGYFIIVTLLFQFASNYRSLRPMLAIVFLSTILLPPAYLLLVNFGVFE